MTDLGLMRWEANQCGPTVVTNLDFPELLWSDPHYADNPGITRRPLRWCEDVLGYGPQVFVAASIAADEEAGFELIAAKFRSVEDATLFRLRWTGFRYDPPLTS